MPLGLGSIGLGFLAGLLSLLSPCVLPLLPLVFGAAVTTHRFGGMALALGLLTSFVTVGLLVAAAGFSLGLDRAVFRTVSAVLLGAFGLVLVSDALHQRFAVATASFGDIGARLAARLQPQGLRGLFVLGLALGAAWTPCVGPTLGAASVLAAQGQSLAGVVLVMLAYGAGVAVPLVALGSLSHEVWRHWRGPMRRAGKAGELVLGAAALLLAALILTGADRWVQALLLNASPDWLTTLTTRY